MSSPCPCGSSATLEDCCQPFVQEKVLPDTPEQLMRSRYTAFVQHNMTYIMKTMTDTALEEFDPVSFKRWLLPLQWEGLTVIDTPPVEENGLFGEVEFIAGYQTSDGSSYEIHERSRFEKIQDRWYYVEGETPKTVETVYNVDKVGRNDPCHCGSGRKFKKCCGSLVA
jgi:SEC-C motif-containing protein